MNHSSHLKLALGAVAIFVVLAALGVPVLANLPLLGILVLCPLMMFFMMRGMNHGGAQDDEPREFGKPDEVKSSTHKH